MIAPLPRLDGPAISCEGMSYSYGRIAALREVGFELQHSEFACVVGPSAAGKTTLLKLVHGQLRPAAGSLVVAGTNVKKARGSRLRELRHRVGVVFQDYKLLERFTAAENVAYALRVADLRLPSGEALRRARAVLRQVGLGGRLSAYPSQLSGGQQQRLAIARALVQRPTVLLADEPTASLDQTNAENVIDLLRRISRGGTTVLVATHDPDLVADLSAHTLTLERGQLVTERPGRPRVVSAES